MKDGLRVYAKSLFEPHKKQETRNNESINIGSLSDYGAHKKTKKILLIRARIHPPGKLACLVNFPVVYTIIYIQKNICMRNNVSCAGSFVHFRNKGLGLSASRVKKTIYQANSSLRK